MEWFPKYLLSECMKEASSWAQHVKQFIILISGIETKSQDQMNKSERCDFMLTEFEKWTAFLANKHPDAAVLPFLKYTTGNKTTFVDGKHLYRNFSDGLRVFHNELNPLWKKVLAGQTSGKSVKELWQFFCYLYWCRSRKPELTPEEVTPKSFDVGKVEKLKWLLAFKFLGPPCEKFRHGIKRCHEFLASPAGLAGRNSTTTKKRKTEKLSRKAYRDSKTMRTKEAVATAYAQKHEVAVQKLGTMQAVQMQLRLDQKSFAIRFDRMMELFKVTDDADMKRQLQQSMMSLLTEKKPSYAEAEERLFGPVVDLTAEQPLSPTADRKPIPLDLDPDSSSESDSSPTSPPVSPHSERTETSAIVEDVLSQSGYVVLKSVIPKPSDDEWYKQLTADLKQLRGTTNYVEIFNNGIGGKSDKKRQMVVFTANGLKEFHSSTVGKRTSSPPVLKRILKTVRPWFLLVSKKIKALKLLESPRTKSDPVLLVSEANCAPQKMHWDFDPNTVQSLIQANKLEAVPVSVWSSFTPNGSDLSVQVKGTVKTVSVDFGDVVVFTGDLIHAGAGSKALNVRGFFHVNHPDCKYNQKDVWLQLQPKPAKKTLGARTRRGKYKPRTVNQSEEEKDVTQQIIRDSILARELSACDSHHV